MKYSGNMTFMMMMFIVAFMQIHTSMAQTRHVVGGDALGWTIPAGGAATYTTWASQQTFRVGDTLFFNFTTGNHNAAEVSQTAYGPCTTANPISTAVTGPATVTLTTAGTHYYICTVGTHCQLGQKLAINVSTAAAPPTTTPPASAPTTPPTATPTPISPPTTTTTPPPTTSPAAPSPVGASPPSPTTSALSPGGDTTPTTPAPSTAARSFTAVVPATFLAVGLALFY